MSLKTLLLLVISISLLFLYLISLLALNKLSKDLVFFIFAAIILSTTLLIFYYYFQDNFVALLSSSMLTINNYLLIREIKRITGHYKIITIPFFITTVYFFSYILLINLAY